MEVFTSLQGGPYHRYRPFGGELYDIFGYSISDEVGVRRLKTLTKILVKIIDWIDSLQGKSKKDLSIEFVRKKTHEFRDELKDEIKNGEFGEYRL